MRPNPHVALIYHYDLARALNGEPVDWQAIPVNVDAGREGGDLCRQAADFAKRRDLFAMVAPTIGEPCTATKAKSSDVSAAIESASTSGTPAAKTSAPDGGVRISEAVASTFVSGVAASSAPNTDEPPDPQVAVPASPSAVGQPVAEPEPPAPARSEAQVSAATTNGEPCPDTTSPNTPTTVGTNPSPLQSSTSTTPVPTTPAPASTSTSSPSRNTTPSSISPSTEASTSCAADRDRLRARIADLIDAGHEKYLRRLWPPDVKPLSQEGHTPAELDAILKCVRSVESYVGAGWHPDDGPPPHVNTDPRAEVAYPVAVAT